MAKKTGKQENFIVWEAPEYEYHPKGVSWHWMSLVIAGALIIFFVWMENFLFVFLSLSLGF